MFKVPASPDVKFKLFMPAQDFNSNETDTAAKFEKFCMDYCGTNEDCFKVNYKIKEHFKRHRTKEQKETMITINVQYGLEEIHQHNPKLDWIECACYIGSALSLWFGASLITISDSKWLKKVKNALHPKMPFA